MSTTYDYQKTYDLIYSQGYHPDPWDGIGLKRVVPTILQIKPASALEIGASNGSNLVPLIAAGIKAAGVEISKIAVETAQAYGRDVVWGCATNIPYHDSSFEMVYSADTMEHLTQDDIEPAIKEQIRVSSKWILHSISPRLAQVKRWEQIAGHNLHLTVRPIEEWKQMFLALGLKHQDNLTTNPEILIFQK